MKVRITLAAAASMLSACHSSPDLQAVVSNSDLPAVETNMADMANMIEPAGGSGSIWHVSERTDPMNDETIYAAVSEMEDRSYSLRSEVSCSSSGNLKYSFATFEGDKGIPIASRLSTTLPIQRITLIAVRLDNAPQETFYNSNGRLGNEFVVVDDASMIDLGDGRKVNITGAVLGSPDYTLFASRMSKARKVVLRFPLQSGDATFQIDQSDPVLRHLIDRCPAKSGVVGSKSAPSGDFKSSSLSAPIGGSSATASEPVDNDNTPSQNVQ